MLVDFNNWINSISNSRVHAEQRLPSKETDIAQEALDNYFFIKTERRKTLSECKKYKIERRFHKSVVSNFLT